MRFLIRLLFWTLILLSAFAYGVSAEHRHAAYGDTVRNFGCTATLVTSDDHQITQSVYDYGTKTLYIGTKEYPGLRQELAEMVFFHEIGHCLQHQSGATYTMDQVARELDADRWAADLACMIGRDGPTLLRDLMLWAQGTWGYMGDDAHGTVAQRIAQGGRATHCWPRMIESP